MNDINKRYNIGLSIINNNQGVKTMLNNIIKPSRIIKSYKIFNRLKSIINKVFENVGYFFIGYKVDIELNQSDILEAKAKIRILRNTQSHNIDDIEKIKTEDIQGIKYHIKAIRKYKIGLHEFGELKKEVEALKDTINILRRDCKQVQEINKDDIKEVEKNLEDFTSRYYQERFVDDMKETKVNELLFTTNNKMLNDCSKELISFIIDADRYEDNIDIKDVNNILRKHINLTNERGQDGTK